MRIVIIGDGKVGANLTEDLAKEGHNIVVIDKNSTVIENVVEKYDVMGIVGNGAVYDIQKEAGVDHADMLIAATSNDELNVFCCIVGKKLGATRTVARISSPEYVSQLQNMRQELGLSMIVNPEMEAAAEISRILRFPAAIKVETFAKGKVELVEVKLSEGNPLIGVKLSELNRHFHIKVLVCAVQRGEEVFIPNGDFRLEAGDKISVTGTHPNLATFFKEMGIFKQRVRRVMIVGGGSIAFFLAQELVSLGMSVKIIEQDETRCMELSDSIPKAIVVHGDGTDQALLFEEGVEDQDAFVALTGIDEENIIVSMFAMKQNIPKVVTRIDRTVLVEMLADSSLDSVITPKSVTSNRIVRYVRARVNSGGGRVRSLYKLVSEQVEALEFRVEGNLSCCGIKLKDMRTKPNLLIASIIRGNKIIYPGGDDTIENGDTVIVITHNLRLRNLEDIMA